MQKNPHIQCRKIHRYSAENSADTMQKNPQIQHKKTDVAEPGDCSDKKRKKHHLLG